MKNPVRRLRDALFINRYIRAVLQLSEADKVQIGQLYDDKVPLPAGAAQDLRWDHPELESLRKRYAALDWPVISHVQWGAATQEWLRKTFSYFRGETPYVWQYRELPRITRLKYFIYLKYAMTQDPAKLLERLGEDGSFGCWRYEYEGLPPISRDLIDSVLEIAFLERELKVLSAKNLRILDIGAGYGRMAHRMLEACPGITDYACVDALPESSFLCRYYLNHKKLLGRARVVPLDELPQQLKVDGFDLALNIHSFSECTHAAVEWWVKKVQELRVPYFLIIPNQPEEMLTNEGNGVKRDFKHLLTEAGYQEAKVENLILDPAVKELMRVHDRMYLFHNPQFAGKA
ncbi:MAG TPA: putative sugar O-methyltransferase [Fontimonas sp.]